MKHKLKVSIVVMFQLSNKHILHEKYYSNQLKIKCMQLQTCELRSLHEWQLVMFSNEKKFDLKQSQLM